MHIVASATNPLRTKVSKRKRRFRADGFDLDLAYITDRHIAMGFPSRGVESTYRNRLVDVRKFLDDRHGSKYRVYNLCSERRYDPERFHGRVARFPFDDHNCPPFDMLHDFLADVDAWLAADDENVVAVHCKAGKGRTGLTLAVHLLHSGYAPSSAESLSHYGSARTHDGKGVTIPSQRRWVAYYEEYMAAKEAGSSPMPPPVPQKLVRIRVSDGAPAFDSVTISCRSQNGATWSSQSWGSNWKQPDPSSRGAVLVVPTGEIGLMKDVRIVFARTNGMSLSKKKTAFSFWFNTQFLPKDGVLRLRRDELDGLKKFKKKQSFLVEAFFSASKSPPNPGN